MRENPKLRTYQLEEIEHLKIHGRTAGRLSPLALFWTGSGIELNVTGSELWVELEGDFTANETWISILVNKAAVSRQMVIPGRNRICIFRGMNESVVKNIRIVRDTQAMSGDPDNYLQLHAVSSDGEFMPVTHRPYKIEFVGDSITSGEGAVGAREEEDWISLWFSGVDNYTMYTAEALNAEARIISQSGWGVLTGWDNNPHCNIPEYYEKVCGVLTGGHNKALGAYEENDFASWEPDIIVVNLGTNDAGAFAQPEWRDEAAGETHKQRVNADGSFHEEDVRAFERAAESFLTKLRKYNKKAYIIWAYGMLGDVMEPMILRAMDAYTARTGDDRISYLKLPDTTDETMGARWHPGKLSHQAAAKVLTEFIRRKGIVL